MKHSRSMSQKLTMDEPVCTIQMATEEQSYEVQ